ncbi:NAD(P)-binding protein [Variovorax sp. PCZ-1]|nr:NAD(P)-binding protein [Variovorax sp. PCZ-1]
MKRRELLGAAALTTLAACRAEPDQLTKITGGFVGSSPEVGHILREAKLPVYDGSPVRKIHTLIAGGGVAGLSAARALRMQSAEDFVLLDLESEVGGNARGGSIAGMAHPLGAHYLPVPGDDAPEVQDFLEELGLRKRISGRWVYDEKALCHSPQERLFFNGAWQEGLLPTQGISSETQQQYQRFAKLVAQWQVTGAFSMPLKENFRQKLQIAGIDIAQAATVFIAYLDTQGLTDPHLRWYLDYCCRDDYGAGIDTVSTFAGMHYFAARHGFSAPGTQDGEKEGVLTWPQGNGFLTQALAAPLRDRLQSQQIVLRIEEGKSEVLIDALHLPTKRVRRYAAQRCIVALPLHVASRVVNNAPDFLKAAAVNLTHSSWWVANIHIDAPLHDNGQGAFPSWDNVIYGSKGLGYVDAMHQSTRTAPGATVLTYYHAEGAGSALRQALLKARWPQLRDRALAEIAQAHPDITRRAQQIDITRYGHAMAVLTPQFISQISQSPAYKLRRVLSISKQYPTRPTPSTPRLRFAHSDWSGYSVFEEAFARGLHSVL